MEKVSRRRKVRWKRVFGLFFILMIIFIGTYSFYQYKQGISIAEAGSNITNNKQADTFKGTEVKFGKINVLLLGSDSRGEKHSRTDSIMIAHYDQNSHQAKLISIMRDTYVDIPGHGKQKINAAYAFGGPELLRQTIEENFNIDVNYFAMVDFKGFSKVVDVIAPDGIEVDVPHQMKYGIGITLNPGKQTLHGDKLLGYVRFRHDNQSDFGRVERQQEVIAKLEDQALSMGSIVKIPKLLGVINPYIETNIDSSTLFSLGKDLITNQSSNIQTLRVPVDGSFTNERFDNVGDVLSINLDENKAAIEKFLGPTTNS
ncbi:transcriptional regulator [Bacillus sp. MUM 116]|uniref:LCP family protein n=1 Tax=Bacillus sp. MUM 116 TaxID=1678002 RepID=UPI0008F5B1B0|nr:LCP family protein [Bacillus sp. MUM 116]OIK13271.1 transcriptional regulator [Bacillus sp. MUM 116]